MLFDNFSRVQFIHLPSGMFRMRTWLIIRAQCGQLHILCDNKASSISCVPRLLIQALGYAETYSLMAKRMIVHVHICITRIYAIIQYSRKYWWELNLVVGFQIAITNVLADLNLVVRYGITILIYASMKFWQILIWRLLWQSAKPPN